MNTDVLIVGAGPTGLALATTLKRSGVAVAIVDRLASGQNTSRAAVIHAHTLEVLEPLGVSERLAAEGLRLDRFSIRDRDRVLVRLRFDTLPSRYAYLLMLPQDRTEQILRDALADAGGDIRWSCALESLVETADGVQTTVASSRGMETIRARYVVGADGMHSRVRHTANIGFTGALHEQAFILADVEMDWPHGRDEVMLFFSPAGLVVVAPLPAANSFRIVATLDGAPDRPGIEDLRRVCDARGPARARGRIDSVLWSSRFRLHHRVADRYRTGRRFLVGDAAHVHSPAGGQGMNTGLVDACVLGRLLADVIAGRCAERCLDAYETLRRPAAKQVLALAGRLTDMATMRAAVPRLLRNFALRTIDALPVARRTLEMNLSGLSRRAAAETGSLSF